MTRVTGNPNENPQYVPRHFNPHPLAGHSEGLVCSIDAGNSAYLDQK